MQQGGWDEAYLLLQLGAALGDPTTPAKTRRRGARWAETPLGALMQESVRLRVKPFAAGLFNF